MNKLTEHFTMEELCKTSCNYPNKPGVIATASLKNLCSLYLEPLRVWRGKPIIINSGFRSKEVNAAVGGAKGSYHLYGCAVDIRCDSMSFAIQAAGYLLSLSEGYIINGNRIAELYISRKVGSIWLHLAVHKNNNDTKFDVGIKYY